MQMPYGETFQSVISSIKYAHGSFNAILLLIFLYQGWLGLRIRGRRKSGKPSEVQFAVRHRNLGMFLPFLVIAGFGGGIGAVFLSLDDFFVYPVHFLNGLALSFLVVATSLISKKIRARENEWRNIHYYIGVTIIFLFAVQVYFGLSMLFGV